MASVDDLRQVRQDLGPVGAFLGFAPGMPAVDVERVRGLEAVGWRALWTNEIIGVDALVRASMWLGATERMVVGTSIANVWARPPQTAHAAATQLAEAYPGRFVFGLGVGNPKQAEAVGRAFSSPVGVARDYLEGMDEATYPKILGANGPKLLALAGEMADGALPADRPPEAIAEARSSLGPDKLLVAYLSFDGSEATDAVRERVDTTLAAGADHVVCGRSFGTEPSDALEWLIGLGTELAGPT